MSPKFEYGLVKSDISNQDFMMLWIGLGVAYLLATKCPLSMDIECPQNVDIYHWIAVYQRSLPVLSSPSRIIEP